MLGIICYTTVQGFIISFEMALFTVLPELPLPSPVNAANKSLLFHTKIADDARKILNTQEDGLVSQLVHALQQTTTDHM